MAHHFDTQAAKDDPRLAICDLYIFPGVPGRTTMVMTTSADVGLSSPDLMHPEGLYAFRFDHDGDGVEDQVFTFRFGEPRHADGTSHGHVQDYTVIQSDGRVGGLGGDVLLTGRTGLPTVACGGVQAFVGVVPELWAADGTAFQAVLHTLAEENRLDMAAFDGRQNLFATRNVMATVLKVPNGLIGSQSTRFWGTIGLFGHAPELQVYRFGFPLFTHLFLSGARQAEQATAYHSGKPASDQEVFGPVVTAFVERLSAAGGAVGDPAAYGRMVADKLCPSAMPFDLGMPGEFTAASMNGRPLLSDAYDAMWSLAAGRPIADGVAPLVDRWRPSFPYYGSPYTSAEQAEVTPLRDRAVPRKAG